MNVEGACREEPVSSIEHLPSVERRVARGRKLDELQHLLNSAALFMLTGGLYLAGFCFAAWSCIVLVPDLYSWAQTGTWSTESAWVLVELVQGSQLEVWLVDPQAWLGLHPIAIWVLDVPLWLGLLFAGLFSSWLAILLGEN